MMNVQLISAISFMHTHTLSMTSDPEKSFIIYTTGEHRKKIFPGKKIPGTWFVGNYKSTGN